MLSKELIQSFCSDDGTRKTLEKPFNVGEFTYATDGNICIKIPRIAEYDTNSVELSDSLKNVDEIAFKYYNSDDEFSPLPDIKKYLKTIDCTDCEGTGKYSPCQDCDGDGEISFYSKSGIEYEVDCEKCDGTGKQSGAKQQCEGCDGTGKKEVYEKIEIEDKLFDGLFIHRISMLPEILIAAKRVSEKHEPVSIKFDGGIGVIMQMRKMV